MEALLKSAELDLGSAEGGGVTWQQFEMLVLSDDFTRDMLDPPGRVTTHTAAEVQAAEAEAAPAEAEAEARPADVEAKADDEAEAPEAETDGEEVAVASDDEDDDATSVQADEPTDWKDS